MVGADVVVGILAAAALGRYAQTGFCGVTATDGVSMAAAVLVMASVAACGSLLPVLRATRIDPRNVLRE
jgi:hypothetical protein